MRFYHRVGRAFDVALNPQRLKQQAHKAGFACAQITLQCNESIAQGALQRQGRCKALGVLEIGPQTSRPDALRGSSYNRRVSTVHLPLSKPLDASALWAQVQVQAAQLGFSQIGVTGVNLSDAEPGLKAWLEAGFHGSMNYMASHGLKRARPAQLVPGTVSVITARLDYLPANLPHMDAQQELAKLRHTGEAVISVYARGRDYHKVLRSKLQKLQDFMAQRMGPFGHRVFTDSAPVMEAQLAVRSGLGWRGKNTLVLERDAGSFFFLGELFVDLALPATPLVSAHCGTCTACIDACPTGAIVGPEKLDARRCISYLTIEHAGPIPLELRPLIGNRIYGCDDCQWVCPWNKFAKRSTLPDFDARAPFVSAQLVTLLDWDEVAFLHHTQGSAIRRIGHARWLRNVALAAGNALSAGPTKALALALRSGLQKWEQHPDSVVQEQIQWSLARYAPKG